MGRCFAILLAIPLVCAAPPAASVELGVANLRSNKGMIHACLTRNAAYFPKCELDPHAVTTSVAASTHKLVLGSLAPGTYAIALFHDETSNRKMDKMMGIPREGFGFSRNPVIRFGPPKFNQVGIRIDEGLTRQTIRIQYIL